MANVFTDEMSLFIKIFQVMALYPSSFILKIYSLFNFGITIFIFISAFCIFPVLENDNSLSLLVGGLVFVGILLTNLMNITQAFFSVNQQTEIYRKFDQIDLKLANQLLVHTDYKRIRRRLIVKYILLCLVLFVIHVISIVSVTVYGVAFSYYVHLIIPVGVIRLRCIQNMFYVDLINEKLKSMNQKLNDMISRNHDKMAFILFSHKLQKFDVQEKKISSSLYEQIITLKQIYGKIFDVSNLINDVFGWSLLFVVTQYFIEFTSNGYWLFLALENLLEHSFAIQSLCSIFPIAILLTTMANSCFNCSENAQQLGVLIHKIERDINSDLQNALIREFSLQLIHEPITITANGFFSINFTLIGGMAASTVTYLVILIQFQLSEIKKTSNSTVS
ncbi:putative gustatory receptor 2a [Chironomus tepperi]|uniref:putative gustatory receptor 2a n=1 Tax=Chironomus tepperi TaxID=113505 RepID=UPI00391F8855